MADITHDGADEGFHEINLSGKQVIALFMLATTVLVFVFLCGVLVGRNLDDRAGAMTTFAASAADTASQTAQAQPEEAQPSADAVDDLSYHRRLQGENTEPPARPEPPPAPPVEEPEPTPTPARTEPAPESVPADVPAEGRPGRFIVQVFASKSPESAASLVRQLTAKGYPAYLVRPGRNDKAPMYRVQVGRYDDRKEADNVSRRLQKEEQLRSWISSR